MVVEVVQEIGRRINVIIQEHVILVPTLVQSRATAECVIAQ